MGNVGNGESKPSVLNWHSGTYFNAVALRGGKTIRALRCRKLYGRKADLEFYKSAERDLENYKGVATDFKNYMRAETDLQNYMGAEICLENY